MLKWKSTGISLFKKAFCIPKLVQLKGSCRAGKTRRRGSIKGDQLPGALFAEQPKAELNGHH